MYYIEVTDLFKKKEECAGTSFEMRRRLYADIVYRGIILSYLKENLCARYNATLKLPCKERTNIL